MLDCMVMLKTIIKTHDWAWGLQSRCNIGKTSPLTGKATGIISLESTLVNDMMCLFWNFWLSAYQHSVVNETTNLTLSHSELEMNLWMFTSWDGEGENLPYKKSPDCVQKALKTFLLICCFYICVTRIIVKLVYADSHLGKKKEVIF